jgi:hypothetical protein
VAPREASRIADSIQTERTSQQPTADATSSCAGGKRAIKLIRDTEAHADVSAGRGPEVNAHTEADSCPASIADAESYSNAHVVSDATDRANRDSSA